MKAKVTRGLMIALVALSFKAYADRKTSISWSRQEKMEIGHLAERAAMVDGMHQLETENWIVRTVYSPDFTAEASYFMEMFSKGLLSVFLTTPECSVPEKPVLTIYGSEEEYAAGAETSPKSRGYFRYKYHCVDGKVDWDLNLYTYFKSHLGEEPEFGDCYLPVIQHEGTHCMLAKIFGPHVRPVWFEEGVAGFYESMNLRSNYRLSATTTSILDSRARKERTQRSLRPDSLKEYLRDNRDAPVHIAYLTSLVDNEKWSPDDMGPTTDFHYALAESFIDFLMDSQDGRRFLRTILERVRDDREELILESEMPSLDSQWRTYLSRVWRVRLPRE